MQPGLTHLSAAESASILGWLTAAGADALVTDAPRNWLAAPPPRAVVPLIAPPIAGAAPKAAPMRARAARIDAPDLAALDAGLAALAHPLAQSGTPPRLLTGNTASGIIVLGDQPDAVDTDAARLTARMLAAIGLDEAGCARAHLLPWPTPGVRTPREEELAFFAPWLARALELAAPRLILAFGDRAAALSGAARGIASIRGQWLAIANVPMLATFHPRILLSQPEMKRLAWADLQAFAARLKAD